MLIGQLDVEREGGGGRGDHDHETRLRYFRVGGLSIAPVPTLLPAFIDQAAVAAVVKSSPWTS
jgi:hypothetical protein